MQNKPKIRKQHFKSETLQFQYLSQVPSSLHRYGSDFISLFLSQISSVVRYRCPRLFLSKTTGSLLLCPFIHLFIDSFIQQVLTSIYHLPGLELSHGIQWGTKPAWVLVLPNTAEMLPFVLNPSALSRNIHNACKHV